MSRPEFGTEAVCVGVAPDVDEGGDSSVDGLPVLDVVLVASEPPIFGLLVRGEDDEVGPDVLVASEVADADWPLVAELLPQVEFDLPLELVEQNAAMLSCVVAFETENVTLLRVAHPVHMVRPTSDGIGARGFTHIAWPPQNEHLVNII